MEKDTILISLCGFDISCSCLDLHPPQFDIMDYSSEHKSTDHNELHDAAREGDLAKVQSLIHKRNINAKGICDQTALVKAAAGGRTEVVKLLLTRNANVNIPDVSTLKMKSNHICIFPFHICILHPPF